MFRVGERRQFLAKIDFLQKSFKDGGLLVSINRERKRVLPRDMK